MSFQCACGAVHEDASGLVKVGWQVDGIGGAMLLVNCSCGSTIVAEVRADASTCARCGRLVTGADGDVKTWSVGLDGDPAVHCQGCTRREGIGIFPGAIAHLLPLRRVRAAALLLGLALAFGAGPAKAFVGDFCRSGRDCSGGGPQFCLADAPTSSSGHCAAGKVLP